MGTGNTIFKIFNPGAPKEDPVARRRGQLRRAQQTYRSRKDTYVKCLEKEFGKVRTQESSLLQECERLHSTVQNLAQLLLQNGIQPPEEAYHTPSAASQSHNGAASSSLSPENNNNNYNTADWLQSPTYSKFSNATAATTTAHNNPSTAASTPRGWEAAAAKLHAYSPTDNDDPAADSPPSFRQQRAAERAAADLALVESYTINPAVASSTPVYNLDQVAVGIEFVLTLERPCLGHIHGDPTKPDEPNGHALTVSSQLICCTQSSSSSLLRPHNIHTHTDGSSSSSPAEDSAMIERLLRLSPDLSRDEEATPVQLWDMLRRQPQYAGMELSRLRGMAGKLREAIQCHGFGGVVKLGVFNSLLYESAVAVR